MTTKDPIREAFEKWHKAQTSEHYQSYPNDGCAHYEWESNAWEAALSLIPHAAEILSGEAKVVLKETKP